MLKILFILVFFGCSQPKTFSLHQIDQDDLIKVGTNYSTIVECIETEIKNIKPDLICLRNHKNLKVVDKQHKDLLTAFYKMQMLYDF